MFSMVVRRRVPMYGVHFEFMHDQRRPVPVNHQGHVLQVEVEVKGRCTRVLEGPGMVRKGGVWLERKVGLG